jgi:hypothetical protein
MAANKPTDLPGTDLLFGNHNKKEEKVIPAPKSTLTAPVTVKEEVADLADSIKIAPVQDTEPVKFTFYFTPQILEDLEVAKFRLRMEKRLKVSKSDIVNAALEYALKDISFLERMVKRDF